MQAAVSLENVGLRFRRTIDRRNSIAELIVRGRPRLSEDFWALRGVTLSIAEGSFHGVIGSNGAGKSTLLKLVSRIYRPTEGSLQTRGRVSSLLELGAGFHPEMNGWENIRLNGAILGLRRRDIVRLAGDIVEFSGVGDFISEPVKHYSSGMTARLGFSIAVHMDPEVLLVDEALSVGDADFQRRCEARLRELRAKGVTLILVSHSLGQVEELCDTVTWLRSGSVEQTGSPGAVKGAYEFWSVGDEHNRRHA